MPLWPSTSSSEPGRTPRRRRLRDDDAGVSEAVGYTLTFGILAAVLVLSMVQFQANQEATVERVASLHADSVGQRVATAVVRTSILAEERELDAYGHRVELDREIEKRTYTVSLAADAVVVAVPGRDVSVSQPLFATGQSVSICATTVSGGDIYVRYGTPPGGSGCPDPSLFLEEP